MEKRNELVYEFLKANIAFTNYCMSYEFVGKTVEGKKRAIRLWRACVNLAEVWQKMETLATPESFATVGELLSLADILQQQFSLEPNDLSSEKYTPVGRRRYVVDVGDYVIVGRDQRNGKFFLERVMTMDFWGNILETQPCPGADPKATGTQDVYAINHYFVTRRTKKQVVDVLRRSFNRQTNESLGFWTLEHAKGFLARALNKPHYQGLDDQVFFHLSKRNPTYRDVILSEEDGVEEVDA